MSVNDSPGRTSFGLLPEPDRSPVSFIASMVINGLILVAFLVIGTIAKRVIVEHTYEDTVLISPTAPPPRPKVKPPEVRLKSPKIDLPKPEPDLKPNQMEASVNVPAIRAARPAVVLARQPKAALTAAMPAQNNMVKASTAPVRLGDTFGVAPNPKANRAATVAAIGNPYGGMQGPAVAPHGVVGSTGIGNGLRSGSNAGILGRVALVGIPGGNGTASGGGYSGWGRVASAGIPTAVAAAYVQLMVTEPVSTSLEIVSKPPVQYTNEARQLRIQGDVVLRVTFTAAGQVMVQSVLRGLGHGLDEEACRVAEQISFRPATRNGRPVDRMTNITITFQLT